MVLLTPAWFGLALSARHAGGGQSKPVTGKGRRPIWAVLAAVLLGGIVYTSLHEKDIHVSDTAWTRRGDQYRVTFQIENKLNHPLEAEILLVATRRRFVGRGEVFDQVGQQPLTLTLEPRERRTVEHHVSANAWGRVDHFSVYAKPRM